MYTHTHRLTTTRTVADEEHGPHEQVFFLAKETKGIIMVTTVINAEEDGEEHTISSTQAEVHLAPLAITLRGWAS